MSKAKRKIIQPQAANGWVITTSPMRKIGTLEEVESPPMDRGFLKNLAYRQWTIQEIKIGQAWRELNDSS